MSFDRHPEDEHGTTNSIDPRPNLVDLARRTLVLASVVLLLVVLVVGAGYVFEVLLLAFAGLLFAIFLRAVTDFLTRHTRLPDKVALGLTLLLLIGLVVGMGGYLAPQVVEQADQLQKTLPKSLENVTREIEQYQWGQWLLNKASQSETMLHQRPQLLSRITGVVSSVFGVIAALFVILFIGFYFAFQPRMYREGVVRLVPLRHRDRAREVMGEVGDALSWWLLGKLVAMVFVGVLVWLMLTVLGLPFALTLGVIAAVLTFIPNFGPIISAIPAVLVGLMDSPATALWVIVLFTAIQGVESYILTPLIQQSAVSIPAALTITSQLILGILVGGIGLALATPLTVVVLVLIRSLYLHDLLGDKEINGVIRSK